MQIFLSAAGLEIGRRPEPEIPDTLDARRIVGVTESLASGMAAPDTSLPSSSSGRARTAPHGEASIPQPGTVVRIRRSAKLSAPWSDYAECGLAMRVRQVDPRRGRKCVSLQPLDSPARSLRYEWFGKDDLEEWSETAEPDLRDLLRSHALSAAPVEDCAASGPSAEAAPMSDEDGECARQPEDSTAAREPDTDDEPTGVSLSEGPIRLDAGPDLVGHGAYTVLIDFYKTDHADAGWLIRFDGGFSLLAGRNRLAALVLTDRGERTIQSGELDLPEGVWHRLALTFSGETGRAELWLDGRRVCAIDGLEGARQAGDPTAALFLGCSEGGGFPGRIDRFRFLDRSLAGEEASGA